MACIALVAVSICTGQVNTEGAAFASIATYVMLADAILGTAIFYCQNKEEIKK